MRIIRQGSWADPPLKIGTGRPTPVFEWVESQAKGGLVLLTTQLGRLTPLRDELFPAEHAGLCKHWWNGWWSGPMAPTYSYGWRA
jgi:hypothetical protein